MDEFIKRSSITGRKYNYFGQNIVRLVNYYQAFYYIDEFGIIPLDIILSTDRKNPERKIILFLFDREETKDAYDSWCNRDKTRSDYCV